MSTLAQLGTNGVLANPSQVNDAVKDLGSINTNQNVDFSLGGVLVATIAGPLTLTFANAPVGKAHTIMCCLTNAGTNITWSPVPKWPGGAAPSMVSFPG